MNLQEFKKSGYKLKLVTAVDFIISDVIIDDTDSELTEDTVNDLNTEFEEAVVGSATESFYQIFDENDDLMFDELSEEDVVKIINELSYITCRMKSMTVHLVSKPIMSLKKRTIMTYCLKQKAKKNT